MIQLKDTMGHFTVALEYTLPAVEPYFTKSNDYSSAIQLDWDTVTEVFGPTASPPGAGGSARVMRGLHEELPGPGRLRFDRRGHSRP